MTSTAEELLKDLKETAIPPSSEMAQEAIQAVHNTSKCLNKQYQLIATGLLINPPARASSFPKRKENIKPAPTKMVDSFDLTIVPPVPPADFFIGRIIKAQTPDFLQSFDFSINILIN